MNSTVDLTWAWLDAIDRATACLRQSNNQASGEQRRGSFQQQQQRGPKNGNNNSNNSAVEESLNYLILLETVLLEHQLFWDQPPTIPPPEWIIPSQGPPNNTTMVAAPVLPLQPPPGVILQPPLQPPNVITPPLTRYYLEGSAFTETNNPFATFQTDDDDDDDEAGDQPIYLQQPQPPFAPGRGTSSQGGGALVPPMVLRRVMIRVVTSMSEVYAHKASACRQERPPKWKLGADTYGQSLFKIHQALQLADSEISRLVHHQEQQQQEQQGTEQLDDDDWLFSCYDDLVQDADIVEVAIQYLTQERDRYRHAAVQQEQHLIQRLNPQWQARDQARSRMGDDKWVQNPAPKNDYWHRRRQDEYQLRDVQAALAQLNQVDTDVAQATSQKLKTRLKQQQQQRQQRGGGGGRGSSTSRAEPDNSGTTNNNTNDSTLRIIEQREQRYNGQRPLDYSKRVSWEEYPDPTNHGWTFTGSWEASLVEFFERAMGAEGEVVKLDWYYTTATMKTSLHHPTQGKTQMFANRVTPSVYKEILQNPRVHTTNQRYQTRQHRPNNNNNNSNNSNRSQYRRQPQQQQQQQR